MTRKLLSIHLLPKKHVDEVLPETKKAEKKLSGCSSSRLHNLVETALANCGSYLHPDFFLHWLAIPPSIQSNPVCSSWLEEVLPRSSMDEILMRFIPRRGDKCS
ncbi:hypothetical protein ACHAWO_008959 [Cyclotella atomus]|uniref:Uncharacterized protein n=1 Tax=Cyclotella atomus TaxID=382360 RepID=A0ABD3QGS8_9STRA